MVREFLKYCLLPVLGIFMTIGIGVYALASNLQEPVKHDQARPWSSMPRILPTMEDGGSSFQLVADAKCGSIDSVESATKTLREHYQVERFDVYAEGDGALLYEAVNEYFGAPPTELANVDGVAIAFYFPPQPAFPDMILIGFFGKNGCLWTTGGVGHADYPKILEIYNKKKAG